MNDRLQQVAERLERHGLRSPGYPRLCPTPGCDGILALPAGPPLCAYNGGPSTGAIPCWEKLTLDEKFEYWRGMKHVPKTDMMIEALLSVFTEEQLRGVIDRVPYYQSVPSGDEYVGWLDYADDLSDKFPDLDAVAEAVAIYADPHFTVGDVTFQKATMINFKKGPFPKDQCAAMRCKEASHDEYVLLDGTTRTLCERHVTDCQKTGQLAGGEPPAKKMVHDDEPAPPPPKPAPVPDVNAEVAAESEQVAAELASVKTFEIVTQDDMDIAADLLKEVKTKYTTYEARLKEITRPMREAEKSVRDLFRPILSGLSEIELLVKRQIANFELRKEAQNKAALEAAAVARAAGDISGTASALASVVHVENAAGISTRPVWKFVIEDAAQVPREFCTPDEAKIRAFAALAGGEEPNGIPGVRWIADVSVTARK